ncbi:MAG: type IV pilus twitching motility protein PilT [Chloroflexota bacterium]
MVEIDVLLKLMLDKEASDLHLKVPSPPTLRINGTIVPQDDLPRLSPQDMEAVFMQITDEEKRNTFYQEKELDCAYSVPRLARFRANVMRQRGTVSINFRLVPFKIPTPEELGLPQICKELVVKPRGLILVTGPTGSGKSTTLASMVNYLNENQQKNIITIEDPIEFLYSDKKCLINQRDLGDDTRSFSIALIHALRHDPDVIVVGELRDLDTISAAIRAAETGHLVMGTLHSTDAPQTIDRLIDVFPEAQQGQIRLQLSQALEGILTQALLPRANGKGRVAAFEIMIASSAVRNIIREKKTFELHGVMQLSSKDGMQTLDQSLADLVKRQLVTIDEALRVSSNPQQLKKLIQYSAGVQAVRSFR